MSTISSELKKCDQLSHSGKPTRGLSGSGYEPWH